jgi:phosphomannomutase
MSLALRYLVEKRKLTGSVVRTVSTTRMIDRLAQKYGLWSTKTVGFNHIADYMMRENVLIGSETADLLPGTHPRGRRHPDGAAGG